VHAGTITNSSASGNVTGGDNVVAGGLVGTSHGIIKFSHASGNVSVGNESRRHEGVGGLAGISGGGGQVTQSFATGHVSGGSGAYVGGLVGYGGNVDNSYATGSAQCTGSCFAGGLIGGSFRGLGIGLSYSTASVGGGQIGGFVGDTRKKALFDTYWDLDTSGVSDPSQGAGNIANAAGVTGLSNTELKSALPAGFDPAIWAQKRKINKSYPYLIANPPQ
jgi:hypothetical protein